MSRLLLRRKGLAADHTAFIFEQMSARLHQHPHYQTLACMHVLVEA